MARPKKAQDFPSKPNVTPANGSRRARTGDARTVLLPFKISMLTYARLVALAGEYGVSMMRLLEDRVNEYITVEARRMGIGFETVIQRMHERINRDGKTPARGPIPAMPIDVFRDVMICQNCTKCVSIDYKKMRERREEHKQALGRGKPRKRKSESGPTSDQPAHGAV